MYRPVVISSLIYLSLLCIQVQYVIGKTIEGLSAKTWTSKATVFYEDHYTAEDYLHVRPFLCTFENVFIDATTVYFQAGSDKTTAVLDLFHCCVENDLTKTTYQCRDKSVHFALCYCFHNTKYHPAIATAQQVQWLQLTNTSTTGASTSTGSTSKGTATSTSSSIATNIAKSSNSKILSGNTWLMHHWSYYKHPDHFSMKLLEFRGLFANQNYTHQCCYDALPKRIDQLVSMDYPISNMTDYERLIMNMVHLTLGKKSIPYITLNTLPDLNVIHTRAILNRVQLLQTYCTYAKVPMKIISVPSPTKSSKKGKKKEQKGLFSSLFGSSSSLGPSDTVVAAATSPSSTMSTKEKLRMECEQGHHSFQELPFWFAPSVYFSPRYKNNIPEPAALSMQSFRETLNDIFHTHGYTSKTKPEKLHFMKPTVVILQRVDGFGLRKMLNFDDVHRLIQSTLQIDNIHMWYISGKTPAIKQARFFNSFDVMISTHSSQLTNLLFARNGSHVIEIQPDAAKERTFITLGEKVGVNYYFLNKNHQYQTNGFASDAWGGWDIQVDLASLKEALLDVRAKLSKHSY